MRFVRGLLDRLVLLIGVIAGGTLPSFLAQYRQRVGGRFDQVLQDLAPYRQIAALRHNGSMEALVQHHLASTDRTFHAEGTAIQAMMDSAERLRVAVNALGGNLFEQSFYVLRQADAEIVRSTWAIFQPAFAISVDGLLFAAVVGIAVWIVFLAIWTALGGLFGLGQRRGRLLAPV